MSNQSTFKSIRVNGETMSTSAATVAELLLELQAPPIGVAVAQNGSVVRRGAQVSTLISEGDEIEIIRAVQGG